MPSDTFSMSLRTFTYGWLQETISPYSKEVNDEIYFHLTSSDFPTSGLTEEFCIAMYAYDHSIFFVPHGWNTAVGLAAELQLVAAVPTARWAEYITPSPYIEDLVSVPFFLDGEGFLTISDQTGLGVVWNDEGIENHSGMRLSPSAL